MSPKLHIVFAFDRVVDLVRLLFLRRKSYYFLCNEYKLCVHVPIQRNYKLPGICKPSAYLECIRLEFPEDNYIDLDIGCRVVLLHQCSNLCHLHIKGIWKQFEALECKFFNIIFLLIVFFEWREVRGLFNPHGFRSEERKKHLKYKH